MEELQTPESFIFLNQKEEKSYDFIPKNFDDYIGQEALKNKLKIYTLACKQRNEALDHMLLFGPPGLGKTTLCQIMADVMSVQIKICSGPMLERTGDLVAILSGLQDRDILFIDEIHRMPKNVEEILYSAMENFKIDVIIGQGAGAKTVSLPLQPFTLIGATTKMGSISAPLRSRFGITEHLTFYSIQELAQVILQNASYLQISMEEPAALLLAKCARGTPRIAKKLLRRVRDFAQIHTNNVASIELVKEAMHILGIDDDGCTTLDNELLKKIILQYRGGPVGVETLASLLGEDKESIENFYEPFLIREGFLEKTPKGRQIPHKKLPYLQNKLLGQKNLF
ncbi:Holliday junction branch migration DNA helicase RuvB [bacterium]|jgi:Holliday junction DNA helicase RuvB|nr:Holliday junction branch migration DNA helicase RuvB [bacterium]NBX78715.1 Holliday junction branch migration DNA helicase RuvB [bacterium]